MTLSRRDLIKLGAGAGLALALPWRERVVRAQEAGLVTKPIPSSGERIPVVGLGTRSYNTGASDEEMVEFHATLEAFFDGGGVLLDTAAGYGRGTSEEVLGEIVTGLGRQDVVFWATKVDREGREEGIARMEESFDQLQTDVVDLMQVHNLRGVETQLATIREWVDAGRIRYVGVTTSSDRQYEDLERLMRNEELDFVQVDYSLGNRSAAERILPLAGDRGMATLINLPFGRTRLFDAVGDTPLPGWAGEIDCETWAQVFLKYVVSHPAVTCAIPGTTQPHHARDNLAAARGRMPDAAMRRRIEEFFDAL